MQALGGVRSVKLPFNGEHRLVAANGQTLHSCVLCVHLQLNAVSVCRFDTLHSNSKLVHCMSEPVADAQPCQPVSDVLSSL